MNALRSRDRGFEPATRLPLRIDKGQIGEGGTDGHGDAVFGADAVRDRLGQPTGDSRGGVHLPVADDDFLTCRSPLISAIQSRAFALATFVASDPVVTFTAPPSVRIDRLPRIICSVPSIGVQDSLPG